MSKSIEQYVNKIICGDCIIEMPKMPTDTFDGIVTDPPYGLGFMGKEWDTFKKAGGSATEWKREGRFACTDGSIRRKNWSRASYAGSYDFSRNAEFQQWFTVWAAECLRIAKPGAIMLIFGGTRTYHRLTCAIEDAGWQIRDCVMWLYGSGFPKSLNISKAIDKAAPRRGMFAEFAQHLRQQLKISGLSHKDIAFNFLSKTGGLTGCVWNWVNGMNVPTPQQWEILQPLLSLSDKFLPLIERIEAEREVVGKSYTGGADAWIGGMKNKEDGGHRYTGAKGHDVTTPNTDLAKLWDGYGTALKPAWEPIVVAMKPLDGTFAQNAEKWGVAGLNIDGGRIEAQERPLLEHTGRTGKIYGAGIEGSKAVGTTIQGRWPANVILDEEAAVMLDEQSGESKSTDRIRKNKRRWGDGNIYGKGNTQDSYGFNDSGGASRFFYCAKASRSERNAGLEGMPKKFSATMGDGIGEREHNPDEPNAYVQNNHPTVKPLKLMEYLCRLVKPPTEHPILLDPFVGSGTTLMAAINTGWDYVGIEKESDYCKIAEKRIAWARKQRQGQKGLFE